MNRMDLLNLMEAYLSINLYLLADCIMHDMIEVTEDGEFLYLAWDEDEAVLLGDDPIEANIYLIETI